VKNYIFQNQLKILSPAPRLAVSVIYLNP